MRRTRVESQQFLFPMLSRGAMESILVNSVHKSLQHFMLRNAIFVCERLCAEFSSEMNLQLLAGCYLQNNQAYAAYHILKGTRMDQSRYLFALACFQMDLLSEAETALSPAHESGLEVPNSAAAHCLLGFIYRSTDRRESAIHHFYQALSLDPFFWAAYEELRTLGSAEEAAVVFGEAPVLAVQKQQLQVPSQDFFACSADHIPVSAKSLEEASPRLLKNIHVKDASGSNQGIVRSSEAIYQPSNCSPSSLSSYYTPSATAS